jgi:anti-sigma factor RsiW
MSALWQRLQFVVDHHWVPGRMSAYLDGELGARALTRVERHTQRCPQCRRLLKELRDTVALLHTQAPAREPAPAELVSAVVGRLRQPGG